MIDFVQCASLLIATVGLKLRMYTAHCLPSIQWRAHPEGEEFVVPKHWCKSVDHAYSTIGLLKYFSNLLYSFFSLSVAEKASLVELLSAR